jgi:hypothetical protein
MENLNAIESGNNVDENAVLNDLLLELGGAEAGAAPDEIIEEPLDAAAVEPEVEAAAPAADDAAVEADAVHDDAVLDEVAAAAELHEATQAAYAEASADAATSAADTPSDETEEGAAAVEAEADAPKGKGKPRAAVRQGPPLSKSQKVVAKLGEKASEFLILELADAELDEEALKAKQEAALAEIDGLAKKVGEKATMLFGWLKNGGALNEVLKRAFTVLLTDGELTSGAKGNLQTNLLAKPYSAGTAASQANQCFMLFPALKITVKEKGRMVANEDSAILLKAKTELGL